MSWTDDRVEKAAELWVAGHSASEVAKAIGGTTRNAVIGKMNRLGLGRSAPSRPLLSTVRKAIKERVVRIPKPKRESKAMLAKRAEEKRISEMPPPECRGAHITSLSRNQCRWPVNGPPKGGEHLFCGGQVHPGKPYCEFHAHKAKRHDYVAPKDRA